MDLGRWSVVVAVVVAATVGVGPAPAGAVTVTVTDDVGLTASWADPAVTEIVVGADIVLGCAARARPAGAEPLVLDGDGRTVTDECDQDQLATLATASAVAVEDLTLIGGPNPRYGAPVVTSPTAPVQVRSSRLVGRAIDGGVLEVAGGSSIVDSSIDNTASSGFGFAVVLLAGGPVTVAGSRVESGNRGLRALADPASELSIETSTVISRDGVAVSSDRTSSIDRSSLQGTTSALAVDAPTQVRDSTLLLAASPQPLPFVPDVLEASVEGDVDIVHSTLLAAGDGPSAAISTLGAPTIDLTASVLALPDGAGPACVGDGTFTSGGDNLVVDGSCDTTAPGDVVVDPRLAPFDPGSGTAPPAAGSPVIDHVPPERCRSTIDQVGTSRPAGAGCEAGAVEVPVTTPPTTAPTSSTTTSTTPGAGPRPGGSTAPPATPIRTAARFTG